METTGDWPTDDHRRLIATISGLFKQKEMEVKASTLVTKQVLLHPRDPTGRRDTDQDPYPFLLLVARADHVDYDEGLDLWVDNIVTQVARMFPAGPNQWGGVHPLALSRAPDTKEEFEDGTRAFLVVIGSPSAARLQNHIVNFNTTKQVAEERTETAQAETVVESAQTAKSLEEEHSKAEKPTSVFPEHLLFDLIAN